VHIEHCFETRVQRPIPARTAPAIEFTFGDPYDVHRYDRLQVEVAHSVAVVGSQTYRRVQLALQGKVETFVIVFQPAGMPYLFSLPGDVIANEHFDGIAVIGSTLKNLACKLGDARSFIARVSIAEEYLVTHIPRSSAPNGITRIAQQLLDRQGCVRISDVACQTGLSFRQFERRFTHEVGITPKLYARIARFEAALAMKERAQGIPWTSIAHELGYYDQMHMVHDFQHLSGESPACIASQLKIFAENPVHLQR
jgi:AraC-like DNA-binding protein